MKTIVKHAVAPALENPGRSPRPATGWRTGGVLLVAGLLIFFGARPASSREADGGNGGKERPYETPVPRTGPRAMIPQVVQAAAFGITPPLRDLPPELEVPVEARAFSTPAFEVEPFPGIEPKEMIETPGTWFDSAVQRTAPLLAIPGPSVSFEALSNQDNLAVFGGTVLPPDTDGDVGPNDYVQMVNLLWRVYDKTGAPRPGFTPPRRLSSLFTSVGAPCAGTNNGDPIVLYDPLADRWLLSEFCEVSPRGHQLIAISQTSDPTGAYYAYDFVVPGAVFNDYPKLGVWPDAYYASCNQFNFPGTIYLGAGAFAFDRAKMLVGDPTASFIYFNLNFDLSIGSILPADMDGLTPPPPGSPAVFAYLTANEYGDPFDALRLFDFHADFANPSLSTFTERAESPLLVAPFNGGIPGGRDHVEQPPPANSTNDALDSIGTQVMHRLAYRNRGGFESLVTTHTVNVGTGNTIATHQAGVRYYELRRTLPGGLFTVNEQATFAPDTDNRWMGSAATDNQGNLAVGYSVSSLTTFPSIRYAGRLATDPSGGLFQGEGSIVAGSFVQQDTRSRWGDYSAISVDPSDDCAFWYTTQYYGGDVPGQVAEWRTRVGKFAFTQCTPAPRGTLQGVVRNAVTTLPIAGAKVQTSDGYVRTTDGAGFYSMAAVPGTYDATASRPPGYLPASATGLVVTDASTTIRNFDLVPIPALVTAGSVITVEGCNPQNSALDPGETATVSLSVRNVGAADTANLVATLLATGGVTSPSGPQSYGAVLAGGAAVSRSFTFTVGSLGCGETVTATLDLQDGASHLGTVTFSFTLGVLGSTATTSTTSSGNLSTPIPDTTTFDVPMTVTNTGIVNDVNVKVRLNHTFDGDVVLSLVHPDGTLVVLSVNRGGSGQNYGSGATDCSGAPTVFDDGAANTIAAGFPPFAGTFRPDFPLSTFNGKPVNGTWKLRVTDSGPNDTGTLYCWQLEINRRTYVCCPNGSPVLSVNGAPVAAENGCPANMALDPGETDTVSLDIQNIGTANTTNLVATLLPGGGVTSPSGPQSYGALTPGAETTRPFTFRVDPGMFCSDTLIATWQLQDGATNYGTTIVTYTLGFPGLARTAGGGCATVFVPLEVTNLRLLPDKQTLVWDSASASGAGTVHDVPRGVVNELPVGNGGSETCVTPGGTAAATATDASLPLSGRSFWYLVRGRNSCGTGTYGARSNGVPRTTSICP